MSLLRRANELRSRLKGRSPEELAACTGAQYDPSRNEFSLFIWGKEFNLSFPGFETPSSSPSALALLLYYFVTADGLPLSGRWISFGDLDGGRFYNQAFQGYTGGELARSFRNDRERFMKAAFLNGGILTPNAPGDVAYFYQALPRVPLLLIYWEGDEDFPASYQVLFDAVTSHYLPTDACAILGSTLTGKIKKAGAA